MCCVCKQVADDASIAMRQTQGRLHRGQTLTAGTIRNQQVISEMIQKDYAYHFLKNVHGSPAYFQRVMYDVFGMIRPLGIPTWFLTLSAADMQWPDIIQTIARQYGTESGSKATLHGIITSFSPMSNKRKCFEGQITDDQTSLRFVGFNQHQEVSIE